jgi:hypothetical protein
MPEASTTLFVWCSSSRPNGSSVTSGYTPWWADTAMELLFFGPRMVTCSPWQVSRSVSTSGRRTPPRSEGRVPDRSFQVVPVCSDADVTSLAKTVDHTVRERSAPSRAGSQKRQTRLNDFYVEPRSAHRRFPDCLIKTPEDTSEVVISGESHLRPLTWAFG